MNDLADCFPNSIPVHRVSMDHPVQVRLVTAPHGSAGGRRPCSTWRYNAVVRVEGRDYIIASSRRLVKWWPSGNWSSTAARIRRAFLEVWEGARVDLLSISPARRGRNVRALRAAQSRVLESRRDNIYSTDL